MDEIEDLHAMRRRLREEARGRREEELRRRREREERRKRRRRERSRGSDSDCCSSSSSSSAGDSSVDLLAASPPPPRPPPSSKSPPPSSRRCYVGGGKARGEAHGGCSRRGRVAAAATAALSKRPRPTDIRTELKTKSGTNSSGYALETSKRLAMRRGARDAHPIMAHRKRQPSEIKGRSTSSADAADELRERRRRMLQNSSAWGSDDDDSDDGGVVGARKMTASGGGAGSSRGNGPSSAETVPSECAKVASVQKRGREVEGCIPETSNGCEVDDDDEGKATSPVKCKESKTFGTSSLKDKCTGQEPPSEVVGNVVCINAASKVVGAMHRTALEVKTGDGVQLDQSSPAKMEKTLESARTHERTPEQNEFLANENNGTPLQQEQQQSKTAELDSPPKEAVYTDAAPSESAAAKTIQPPTSNAPETEQSPDPIIGKSVRAKSNVDWTVQKQCLLVRAVGSCAPKSKVAGFDLDNTLVNWRCAGWPSRPEHYELWNARVVDRMRHLHDVEGYKLVVFSNQGGVRGAFDGKKAATVRGIIDWVAKVVDRPLYAVCSTKKNGGYHKGNPGMWNIMEEHCNCGREVSPDASFFVGDADGTGDATADVQKQQHQQSGTDRLFAENVGKMRDMTMQFYTPAQFFGKSNVEHRESAASVSLGQPAPIPEEAMRARAALMGGYLNSPILLMLVGAQGSGKSSFCHHLLEKNGSAWCVLSQDTIKKGRPGTREQVEMAVRDALRNGKSVVVDRMHLNHDQRSYFVRIGKELGVTTHALVMLASKEEIEDRVKKRRDHPGKVEGVNGARIAVSSLSKLVLPTYDEGFALISYSYQFQGKMQQAYQRVSAGNSALAMPKHIALQNCAGMKLPMITLGSMNVNKREMEAVVSQAVDVGVKSLDTAPTYNNEREVGMALQKHKVDVITIKVPKRVTCPEQARKEVKDSLTLLKCSKVDIILLHWPCDLIVAGALLFVWKELETMKREGLCRAIGVSNFSKNALALLLSKCDIKPVINQVEIHPLLPQWELVEYCDLNGITVQAHSPLGNGSNLLLGNDIITRVAEESSMSPSQVVLLWNVQHHIPVVTKFTSVHHAEEIRALLQEETKLLLIPQHMRALDGISFSGQSHRFVAPPFMFKTKAAYSWGDAAPKL